MYNKEAILIASSKSRHLAKNGQFLKGVLTSEEMQFYQTDRLSVTPSLMEKYSSSLMTIVLVMVISLSVLFHRAHKFRIMLNHGKNFQMVLFGMLKITL